MSSLGRTAAARAGRWSSTATSPRAAAARGRGARPARRRREDVMAWQDGRRTRGPVFVYRDIVEQGGERAGRLEDIRTIELGTARLDRRAGRESGGAVQA